MEYCLFVMWLAGFFVNAGIYLVWNEKWKVSREPKLLFVLRVALVLVTSWFGFGIVVGRVAKKVLDSA